MDKLSIRSRGRRGVRVTGKALIALLMVGASLTLMQSTAGAAARPSDLADIAITRVDGGRRLVGTITKGGAIYTETIDCSYTTCTRDGWTYLGSGYKSVSVNNFTGESKAVVIARRTNGDTWYRRLDCSSSTCAWENWRSLGGRVVQVEAGDDYGYCVSLGGRTASNNIYTAEICENSATKWSSAKGKLKQFAVSNTKVFGTSPSGNLWRQGVGNKWVYVGGNITQPVVDNGHNGVLCGLSPSRNMWCYKIWEGTWSNVGGSWKRLDDGTTVGITNNWTVWLRSNAPAKGFGGRVNQVAVDGGVLVGIGSDYRPWFRTTAPDPANKWHQL